MSDSHYDIYLGKYHELSLRLALPEEVRDPMAAQIFRGPTRALANNSIYESYPAMCRDKVWLEALYQIIIAEIPLITRASEKCRLSIHHPSKPIGWSRTIPLSELAPDQLEPFPISAKAKGLRVKPTLATGEPPILAPFTSEMSLVLTFTRSAKLWKIIIRDIYLGPTISKLEGNVSERSQVAFFDSNHPGQPLP